jgi:hypothetical protein
VNLNDPNLQTNELVEIQCEDRWQVYSRLQELEIPCWCSGYQPLRAQVTNAMTAIQVWSVVRQVTLPRQMLRRWLEDCWQTHSFPEQKL